VATPVVRYTRGVLTDAEVTEMQRVDALAAQLRSHLDRSSESINRVHIHGAASKSVQDVVAALLVDELGFVQEWVVDRQLGFTGRPRPDFYMPLAKGRGVIAEVERGGTTTNNHDLKDLWKAHLAEAVQHLFLVVPQSNWREDGTPRDRPYSTVSRRLQAFFGDARREIDLVSCHIFGYGTTTLSLLERKYVLELEGRPDAG
jgi:hypothetical protein